MARYCGPQPDKAEKARRLEAVRQALSSCGNNVSAISRETALTRQTVRRQLRRLGQYDKPIAAGTANIRATKKLALPRKGQVKRYIFTSAQNNTYIHEAFWQNLTAFAKHVGAVIHVSRFVYNKTAYASFNAKPTTKQSSDYDDTWYDDRLKPYFSDNALQVAPGLVWCGEMNILPTAVRPLSGFETYTGRNSGIFPHAKISLESIVAMAGEGTKFNYTTGAVTLHNYIQRKAGLKANFHHAFGALLVEVDSDGHWYCRHLNATSDGSFYDLTTFVSNGRIKKNQRVEAINWGDTHAVETDETVKSLAWGDGGMLDQLRPKYQLHHDLFSMRSRSHHEDKDCHARFRRHVDGEESVDGEAKHTAHFLNTTLRPFCETVVVDSNHDQHLTRWLRDGDFKRDPVNAQFYLEAQNRFYQAIAERDADFHLLEWVLRERGASKKVRFLRQDESFVICPEHGGGIECGMHGDLGPNGARGSLRGLVKLGRKFNVGHSHSAGIFDGGYQAGTSSRLRLDYVKGPSSHSHSHIVTYHNGKRAIVTMYAGKWRA